MNEIYFSLARCRFPRRFLKSIVRVIRALSYSLRVSQEAIEEYILSLVFISVQISSHIKIPDLDSSLMEFVMSQQATGYPCAPSSHIKSKLPDSFLERWSEFCWRNLILFPALARLLFLLAINLCLTSCCSLPYEFARIGSSSLKSIVVTVACGKSLDKTHVVLPS